MSQNSRMKNKNMAADMKKKGVTRTTANCPMCHNPYSLSGMMNHLRSCGTGRRG